MAAIESKVTGSTSLNMSVSVGVCVGAGERSRQKVNFNEYKR